MIVNAGEYHYQVLEGWGRGAEGRIMEGHTGGIAFGPHGQVYISRYNSGTREVLVFDADGRFIRSWGKGLFAETHYIGISPEGFVFCADPGDHTVRKFTPEGELLMTLGTIGQTGEPGMPFNAPTKAVVSASGDIFIADGYKQDRIHRFAPDGKLLYSWGSPGAGPGQLNQPHGLCLDPWGRVLVADRANNRVQIFDQEGKFLEEWSSAGLILPHDICIDPDKRVFVNDGAMGPIHEGRISIFSLEGELIARFGANDTVPPFSSWMHGVSVDARGDLYVTDLAGVQKLKRI